MWCRLFGCPDEGWTVYYSSFAAPRAKCPRCKREIVFDLPEDA